MPLVNPSSDSGPSLEGRADIKRQSREADERDLASGARSPGELKRENTHFARLKVRLDLSRTRALS